MQLSVKGKQIDVGEALRQHVESQLKDITGKYFSDTLDAHVTFSREAHMFRADIAVHAARGILLQSNGSAAEPYPALIRRPRASPTVASPQESTETPQSRYGRSAEASSPAVSSSRRWA